MTESTSNWNTVAQFGRIPYETARRADKVSGTMDAKMVDFKYGLVTRVGRYGVLSVGFFAACALVAYQISTSDGSAPGQRAGDFVVLISYWAQVTSPLSYLASSVSNYGRWLVEAEKLLILLEKKPVVEEDLDAPSFEFINGTVEFQDVSFTYDGKQTASDNISFVAEGGRTIALVGETGGGKSTILKLLFRFYDPESGRILIDAQDIRKLNLESFRRHIAMVPQNPTVFNMSILDNVRYPDIDISQDEVERACKAASLHEKIMTFKNKYQEKVGERGSRLSGGELQRLAIARAILKKPRILLLDEATSSVDSVTEAAIQDAIRKLSRGITTIAIAHRLSTIRHADHILVIKGGKVVESGAHEELLERRGAYDALWSSQVKLHGGKSRSPSLVKSTKRNDTRGGAKDNSNDKQTILVSNKRADSAHDQTSASARDRKAHDLAHANRSSTRGRTPVKEMSKPIQRSIRHSPSNSPKGTQNMVSTSVSPSRSMLKPDAPEFVPKGIQPGGQTLRPTSPSRLSKDPVKKIKTESNSSLLTRASIQVIAPTPSNTTCPAASAPPVRPNSLATAETPGLCLRGRREGMVSEPCVLEDGVADDETSDEERGGDEGRPAYSRLPKARG